MKLARGQRRGRERFWPQALAVLVPLLVLTGLALRELRDDRVQARAEALRQAEQLATRVAEGAARIMEVLVKDAREVAVARYALELAEIGFEAEEIRAWLHLDPTVGMDAGVWRLQVSRWMDDGERSEAGGGARGGQAGTGLGSGWEEIPPMILVDEKLGRPMDPVPRLGWRGGSGWEAGMPAATLAAWHDLQVRAAQATPQEAAEMGRLLESFNDGAFGSLQVWARFEAMRLRSAGVEELAGLLEETGAVRTEAGLPLVVPGLSLLIETWKGSGAPVRALVRPLGRLLLRHPTTFEDRLLEQAEVAVRGRSREGAEALAGLRRLLKEAGWRREFCVALPDPWVAGLGSDRIWIDVGSDRWFASWQSGKVSAGGGEGQGRGVGRWVLLSEERVEREMAREMARYEVPAWAGLRLEVGGMRVGERAEGEILAEATGSAAGGVRAVVMLVHADRLWADVLRRRRTYGWLVVAVAVTAGLGLWQAWRAFQRQQQLAEMRVDFVSSVSHELRAPIASIGLLAEGLERGQVVEAERRQEYHRLMVQECRRLAGLIENVLDYARIEQSRREYERDRLDPVRLVGETVRLMEPVAKAAEVRMDLQMPAEGVAVPQPCWDGVAVQRALVNLMDNAIKHAPAGSVVDVVLDVRGCGQEGGIGEAGVIRIAVRDRGAGIPVADQRRIFERFYRRGSELRRETQGIGIGLSLALHTVRAHGGDIRVQSTPGHGSLFVIELPVEGK